MTEKPLIVKRLRVSSNSMVRTMKRVRDWLFANKILFETVAASLLSLMAIIVSIAQTRTASKQTELLALQTRIAEAQALPQFEVAIRQKLNDATGKFDDDHLVVSNRGGPVHDFSANAAYFISVTAGGIRGEVSKSEVPVNGYFTASFVSVASAGELVTMIGNHNNASVATLARDVREVAHARQLDFGHLDEQLVVRLRYRDLLDRQHEEYYEVRPVHGGTRMADEVGKARFLRWTEAQRIELSNLRANDLLKDAYRAGVGQP